MQNNSSLYLSKNQILEYSIEALKGDSVKSSYLYDYYALYDDNFIEGEYWLMIGAENGDETLEYSYACILKESHDDYFRAIFYLKKSSEKGNEAAKTMLQRLMKKIGINEEFKINENDFESINENNIHLFYNSAKSGSVEATEKLVQYYKTLNTLNITQSALERISDETSYIYWIRIGAQNGSKNCIKEYIELLQNSPDKNDNIRAEFWSTVAAKMTTKY